MSANNRLTLNDLRPGSQATIVEMSDPRLIRFQELGLLPGTRLTLLRRAPLGDPVQVEIGGSLLSIRKSEARFIVVELAANAMA